MQQLALKVKFFFYNLERNKINLSINANWRLEC